MKKNIFIFLFLLVISQGKAQEILNSPKDTLYREDQLYFGISHTMMLNTENEYTTNGISPSLDFGFIRDFPINKQRNKAIGVGLGVNYQNLRNNLVFINTENNVEINDDYTTNRLRSWYIDVPLEYRWRTSTAESFKFWRIYTGIKYSYLLSSYSYYNGVYGDSKNSKRDLINNHQLRTYLSVGYNDWNFRISVQLTPLLSQKAKGNAYDYYPIDIGIIFYIL